MGFEHESRIQGYLQGWLDSLEERLEFPKNTWRRRQEIQNQIADVQKRLAAVQRSNRRDRRGPNSDHRYSSGRSYQPHTPRPIQKVG